MKPARSFVVNALISGLITVVPIYLAVLLLLKAMASVLGLVSPFARLLPEWLPAENLLALLLLLVVCFVVDVAVRTAAGRAARERLQTSLFSRPPGSLSFEASPSSWPGTARRFDRDGVRRRERTTRLSAPLSHRRRAE